MTCHAYRCTSQARSPERIDGENCKCRMMTLSARRPPTFLCLALEALLAQDGLAMKEDVRELWGRVAVKNQNTLGEVITASAHRGTVYSVRFLRIAYPVHVAHPAPSISGARAIETVALESGDKESFFTFRRGCASTHVRAHALSRVFHRSIARRCGPAHAGRHARAQIGVAP